MMDLKYHTERLYSSHNFRQLYYRHRHIDTHTHTHTQAHTHKHVGIKIQIIVFIGNNHLCAELVTVALHMLLIASTQPYTDDCCQHIRTRLTTSLVRKKIKPALFPYLTGVKSAVVSPPKTRSTKNITHSTTSDKLNKTNHL